MFFTFVIIFNFFLHFTLCSDLVSFFHVYQLTNDIIYKWTLTPCTTPNSRFELWISWPKSIYCPILVYVCCIEYLFHYDFFHDTGVWTQGFTGASSNTILMLWIMHITCFDHIQPYYSPFPFPHNSYYSLL
jgi:hypothetical protein